MFLFANNGRRGRIHFYLSERMEDETAGVRSPFGKRVGVASGAGIRVLRPPLVTIMESEPAQGRRHRPESGWA
jgi:hypothetical protein